MNKMTRVLVMTGMALVAGATVGAGPASAAPAGTTTTTHAAKGGDHDRVVNYYRNPLSCNRAGRIGEQRNSWDSHDCSRVRGGSHRGWWALSVSWKNHGHDQHGQSNHGHDQHGHDQHGGGHHGH